MITIVRYHGIIPVPVEVDLHDLGCTLQQVQDAYTPNTKGIMLSYTYGSKFNSAQIIDWAHSKGLFIIEDAAEAFNGTDFTGKLMHAHPLGNDLVDFTTYSFGNIKTLTSLGGSINVIRNNEILYRKMQQIEATYPVMTKTL